jgi:hypothetical protein
MIFVTGAQLLKQVVCPCHGKAFCVSCTLDSTCFPARRERQKQSRWLRTLKNSQRTFQSVATDDKWIAIMGKNCVNGEVGFNRQNVVKAVESQWKRATEDFTATNQRGTFRHSHDVTVATVNNNDEGDAAKQR